MENLKERIKGTLKVLTEAMAPTGNEQEVIKLIYNDIKPYADEIHVSPFGNMVAIKRGARPGPAIWLDAHVDEVGFIVRNILPNGFLKIDKMGAAPDVMAVGRKVWVTTKRIPGVIGARPGHLVTADEATRVPTIDKSYVDLGVNSEAEARALGIKIGDPIVIQSDFMELSNPDIVCTRAIDDRINCAVLVELLKVLKAEEFGGTVYCAFSVREEGGRNGAAAALFHYDVDYALALDTIPTCDTPGYDARSEYPVYLGKGPALCVCEAVQRDGMTYVHPAVREIIEKQAEAAGVNLQTLTFCTAGYATNATRLSVTKAGTPSATLTVPRRYSHSPVELVNINDAVDMLVLLQHIVSANENAHIRFVDLD